MSIWSDIKKTITGEKAQPKPGPNGSGGPVGALLSDEVISFGDFVAMRLPPRPKSTLARDDVIQKFASSIAERVRDALGDFGIEKYSLIELYMPNDTEKVIKEFFSDSDPKGVRQFERTCEGIIFGVGTNDLARRVGGSPRVYVVQQRLDFHPAFDPIVNDRLIVRPLGIGNTTVPLNPSDADYESDQLLLGLFQVRGPDMQLIDQASIWAWRSIKDQNSIRIDVDFDILSRAFGDADWHKFPLGLAARCSFKSTPEGRIINSVTVDISGVKKWTEYLRAAHGKSPITYAEANAGAAPGQLDISKHTLDSIELRKERVVGDFSIGTDEYGEERVIPINRVFSMRVVSDKEFVYTFGFFDRALNYVPTRNVMSVTGQLVPADEPTEIMLPPGPGAPQEPVFSLTPTGEPGRFKLGLIKSATYDLVLNGNHISVGDDVEIGDTIRAVPRVKSGPRSDDCDFSIQNLRLIPEKVRTRPGRRYGAFVKVSGLSWRQFVLHDKEHIFGRGIHLSERARGLAPDALRFKRPWVSLSVLPGRGQDVYLTKKSEGSSDEGGYQAELLGGEGRELDLNANYEVYVGDFQITLILRATPTTRFS